MSKELEERKQELEILHKNALENIQVKNKGVYLETSEHIINGHYERLLKALTPPTEQEVCEHLNETFGLKGKNTNLHFIYDKESREFRMVSQGQVYRYISTKRQSEDSIEFIDLDIDDIVILGRFYERKEELK